MLTIAYAPGDAAVAVRIQDDLNQALANPEAEKILIVLISPDANRDEMVQQAIIGALDRGQHILPVVVKPAPLPKWIDHLEALDFTTGYNLNALVNNVTRLSGPDAGRPLKVRTPSVRTANRRAAYVIALVAFVMFLGGLYLVGVMGVQAPPEEYNNVRLTETALVGGIVDRYLPRSTEDAIHFQSTLDAAPTRLRPLLSDAATSTAAEETPSE